MNTHTRLRWLLKVCAGAIFGFSLALLLSTPYLWMSVWLGIGCTILGAAMCLRRGNKILSCFLAASLATSPNVLAGDNYAGFNGQECYCFTPAVEAPEPEQHVFLVDFIIEANEFGDVEPRITSVRHPDPSTLISYDELNQCLAAWGISLGGGEQYAKNGQPATAAEMPFVFSGLAAPLTIYPDREQYQVVVEVATQLEPEFTSWQSVARFSVPAGVPINFQDSPEGSQAFYRVRLERPPEDFQAQGALLLGCGLGLLAGSAVISILAVRACARNKKKFEKLMPPKTNDVASLRLN